MMGCQRKYKSAKKWKKVLEWNKMNKKKVSRTHQDND